MELTVTNKRLDTQPISRRLTQGEALVDRPRIVLPKTYEGLDISGYSYEIRATSDKDTMVRADLEKAVEGDELVLLWTVTAAFTAVSGPLSLTIVGTDADGEEIIKITSDKIIIREDPDGSYTAPPPDLLNDALRQMSIMQAAANTAKETAEAAQEAAETARDTAGESAQQAATSAAGATQSASTASAKAEEASASAEAADASAEEAKHYTTIAGQIAYRQKGWYPNLAALEAAYPTGENGWWAVLGDTDSIWVWDSDTGSWKDSGHGNAGSGNVYMDGGGTIKLEGSFADSEHEIKINDDLPPASEIGYDNAGSGLEAVTMQEAIDEVNTNMKAETAGIQDGVAGVQATADEILSTLKGQRPKRYGYRVKISEPDPSARVEYLYDAVGMTPAFMDYANGAFNLGTWGDAWFVRDNYPVMLKYDGTEDYRLNPNDYTKKQSDGTASDVANTAYGGNAMTAIPCCWVKRWQEDGFRYVVFCETQYDQGYKAYAHTRADGSIEKVHYYPMFKGCMVDGKLRSLSGQYPQYSTTATAERTAAKANGDKWDLRTWAMDELIADLLVLISKSTNSQAAFGQGQTTGYVNDAAQHYGHIQSGALNDKGQFFGYNDKTHQVKVFHMEGFWGGRWDREVGLIYTRDIFLTKMTPEGDGYNFTGEGYVPATAGNYGATSGNGYQRATVQTEYGCFPVGALTGSSATFECDNLWHNKNVLAVCFRGGDCSNGPRCGARCLAADSPASDAYWHIGGSLSCQGPS